MLSVVSGDLIVGSSQNINKTGKLHGMASLHSLYYFFKEIGKDKVEENMVIPDNAEPHNWEPAPLI